MSELKPQRYKEERPAEQFQYVHEHSRTHRPNWVYEVVRLILTPVALILYRTRAIKPDNIPGGPVILAPNHFSNMDHFFAGVHTRRKIRFMAKSQLFGQNRILDFIFVNGGVFPVMRGHHDQEAFITAHSILDSGGCVLMYAEGGRSRSGQLGEPKAGVGRLALESGVPVVPVAIHGSKGVRSWKRLVFPKVTVQYAEPIVFPVNEDPTHDEALDAAREIFDQVKAMYTALEERGRGSVIKSLRDGAAAAATAPPSESVHS